MDYTNIFYKIIEKRYKRRKLDFSLEEIKKNINILVQQANENYQKLAKPRFCSLKAYISVWINEKIGEDIAQKSVKPLNPNDSKNNFKDAINFYQKYPPSSIKEIKQKNLNDIRKRWLLVVKERNKFALDNDHKSSLNMYLKNSNIPKLEYDKFLKKVNEIINFYPKPIQNIDNFCPVCNSEIFPFKNLSDFLIFFKEKNVFYKKNKNRIKIQNGNYSNAQYIKETDTFEIIVDQNNNINHQILDLNHELAHVDSMAKILKQDKFLKPKAYFLEKSAIRKEIIFLKKYFPKALKAKLGNVMKIICQTLFEIEIYQNPQRDPNKIYLNYLKKCSKNVTKSDSWNYLINQDILYKSFSQLIYAIAYVNVLESLLSQKK